MQEFATRKAIAHRMDLRLLNCLLRKYRVAVRIMKLTIILLAACLQLSARGLTQTVTISVKDAPLLTVLKAIKKQTGFVFFISSSEIKRAKNVSITANNLPLEQVLDMCFKDQPLTYTITGKWINILPRIQQTDKANDKTNFTLPLPQNKDINGVITDENGAPAQGVNVTEKGTGKGTSTNYKGEFQLKDVNENAYLVITSVGYDKIEVPVKGKPFLSLQLKIAVGNLDEMQVIAYGTTSKRYNTGNVSTVKSIDIAKQPVNNPLLALQGRVPGLLITQTTGFAGSGVSVQIQGQTTMAIGVGTDPLYVVDGVPYPSRLLASIGSNTILGSSGGTYPDVAGNQVGRGNPLSFINPADIESIDILKDADATAIYGSRAANGAILITTKKGKAGKTKVDFNLQTGMGKVGHFLDVLNRQQYLAMRLEAFSNDNKTPGSADYDLNGTWDTTISTDWQKELIGGTAHYTDLQANVSGGTTNTQFLIGTGFHKETTVFPGDLADKRGSFHFSINNTSPNQKFTLQLTGNFMADNNKLMSNDLTGFAVTLSPVAPNLYNSDGSLNWALLANGNSTWTNPLAYFYNAYSNKTNNLVGNLVLGYKILPGLNLKSSFGYNDLESEQYNLSPLQAVRPENRPNTLRSSNFSNSRIASWIVEPSLDYKVSLGKATITSLAGATFLDNTNTYKLQSGSGYSSDIFIKDISAAATKTASNGFSEYKYNAIYGRFTFNWAEKYLLNFTGRRDGSSRFGSENKFHNFGSVAGAWIFTKETFFNNISFISYGKIRASYGTTGNDQIGDYRYLNLYNSYTTSVAYQNATGLLPNGLPNSYLQWEETRKLQFGLDLGFFKERFLLNANYYQNRSSNQLLDYKLPITAGFGGITRNFPATIQNTGWEISLNTKNLQNADLQWSSNINVTIPKNKLLKFPGIESSSYYNSYKVGQPVTILNRYHLTGVDPIKGAYLFEAKDGSLTSSPNSATDLVTTLDVSPKFYGGVQNSFSYKGFELDILFQFVKQIGLDYSLLGDGKAGNFSGVGNTGNQPVNVLNRWQKTGDEGPTQRFYSFTDLNYFLPGLYATALSDGPYTDASYIRLKNVSLSWQVLPKWAKLLKMQNARIYLLGQNLLTITSYKGMDPETKSSTSLPPLRVITAGVQVSF